MKKDPWLAASLNFIFPGAGYYYLGKNKIVASILIAFTLVCTGLYFVFYQTNQNFLLSTLLNFITILIPAFFAVDAYKRVKKAFPTKERKSDLRDKKSFRYTVTAGISLMIILNIIIASSVIQVILGYAKYASLSGELLALNQPLYDLTNNITLVMLGGSLLAIPYISNKLKNKKISLKSLFLAIVILFSSMMALIAVDDYYRLQTDPEKKTESKSEFSANDLIEAVNKKRSENGISELTVEPSTCAVAKVRIEDLIVEGPVIMADNAAGQRAVDKALKDSNLDVENMPDIYTTYYTYQENVSDIIGEWSSYEENDIFTNKNYSRGCAVVKDGYGLFVLGEYTPDATVSDSNNTPANGNEKTLDNIPGPVNLL